MQIFNLKYIKDLVKRESATSQDLLFLKQSFPKYSLPDEFFEILKWSNGFDALIGKTPLNFYSIETIITINKYIENESQTPNCFVFGTDTGITYFSYFLDNYTIVESPSTAALYSDKSEFIEEMSLMGGDFKEFLENL